MATRIIAVKATFVLGVALGLDAELKKEMKNMEYKIGMKVSFGRPNGEKTVGLIVKVNPKKLKIEQTEIRGRQRTHSIGTVWTVPKDERFVQVLDLNSTDAHGSTGITTKTPSRPHSRSDAVIIAELQEVECGLSPENLSCDGERSHTDVMRVYRRLNKQKATLHRELGREPTFDELWG